MKIICPACEIWLVDLIMTEGEGSFWCLRCCESDSRKELRGKKGYSVTFHPSSEGGLSSAVP
jgi:hypothetical protein